MDLRDAMLKRKSVRTYTGEPVPEEIKQKLRNYIETVNGPFNTQMQFGIIDMKEANPGIKLGTYGFIKGASTFICAVVKKEKRMEENLGYVFEKIILYATSLGLGTCWLGSTFKRSEFGKALGVGSDELVPVVTPVGYENEKKSLIDNITVAIAKPASRKDWSELFFDNDFTRPLGKEDAGVFQECLDMVRIAPSASNKQPWRIVRDRNVFHFFICRTPGYGKLFNYDIQKLDLGIAMCHFELTAQQIGVSGRWDDLNPGIPCPGNTEYLLSYIAEQNI